MSGWVKLKQFVPLARVGQVLDLGRELMGEDGDRNPPPKGFSYFSPRTMRGLKHPVLGPVIENVGQTLALLWRARRRWACVIKSP